MANKQDIIRSTNDLLQELQWLDETVLWKIKRFSNTQGLIDTDELETLIADQQETATCHISPLLVDVNTLMEDPTEYRRRVDSALQRHTDLSDRIDTCEEMFHKYNVPRNSHEAVETFMGVWRLDAESGRAKGCRSYINWLQRLNSAEALEQVRVTLIETGTQISCHLGSYLAMVPRKKVDQKVFEIKMTIRGLGIEKDSVIVERFLSALALEYKDDGTESRPVSTKTTTTESDLAHLIFREILRLEVSLNCPDLPMMLTGEIFVSMADHLRSVIEKKLTRVRNVMDRFMEDLGRTGPGFTARAMDCEIKKVWTELDLSSGN